MSRKVTLKQRKFALAFAGESNGNAVDAARVAGYKGSDATLRAIASQNLTKLNISDFIKNLRAAAEKQASDKILSATEVLVGLTRFALADPGKVFEADGSFDLQKAQDRGVSCLIKSISTDPKTGRVTKVELHNAHQAHVDLGKYWKLFTDKLEISGAISLEEKRAKLAEIVGWQPEEVPVLDNTEQTT